MNSIPHILQLDTSNELEVYDLRKSTSINTMLASKKQIVSHECYHYNEIHLDIGPFRLKSMIGKIRLEMPSYTKAIRFTDYVSKIPFEINFYSESLAVLHLDRIKFSDNRDYMAIEKIELRAPDSLLFLAECVIKGDKIVLKAHNIYLRDIDFPDNADVEITVLGSSASNSKRGIVLDNVKGHITFKNELLEDIPATDLQEKLVII